MHEGFDQKRGTSSSTHQRDCRGLNQGPRKEWFFRPLPALSAGQWGARELAPGGGAIVPDSRNHCGVALMGAAARGPHHPRKSVNTL